MKTGLGEGPGIEQLWFDEASLWALGTGIVFRLKIA